MAFLITAIILLLALCAAPIYAIIGAGALYAFHAAGIDMSAVIVEMLRLASLPALIAIPLFTFSGFVLAESGAPRRMLDLMKAAFGWLPGGIATVALVTTAVFTAFTGASGVTIIALGGLLYPMLRQQGYSENFSLGLMTTTGSLGLLFPPSLPIILYGLVAKISIDRLFAAAAIPGLLIMAVLAAYCVFTGVREKAAVTKFSWKELGAAARAALWEIPLPFLIIGGIYGGLFTATEAASIMAVYVLVTEVFIYRDLKISTDLPRITAESMTLVGAIILVLGTALGLTNYFIDADVPARIFDWLHTFVTGKVMFLLILNAFLLVVNMIEIFSAIIIVVPVIAPVAAQYGIDPVHLGVIFLLNLEIGYMTPPLGLNLFLASGRFGTPLAKLYGAVWKFWLLLLASLLIVTYMPALSIGGAASGLSLP